ncbi:MAG: hypothetical protein SGPRY_009297 [Prymnesium sp.]
MKVSQSLQLQMDDLEVDSEISKDCLENTDYEGDYPCDPKDVASVKAREKVKFRKRKAKEVCAKVKFNLRPSSGRKADKTVVQHRGEITSEELADSSK